MNQQNYNGQYGGRQIPQGGNRRPPTGYIPPNQPRNQYNQGQMQNGMMPNNQQQGSDRCFITSSAKQLVDSGALNYPLKTCLIAYFKKRAIAIIVII